MRQLQGVWRLYRGTVIGQAPPFVSSNCLHHHTGHAPSEIRKVPKRSSSTQDCSVCLKSEKLLDDAGHTNFSTLHELQVNSCRVFSSYKLFGTFRANSGSSSYEWISYADFDNLVARTRALLKDIGVEEYTKVGIISNNRWEWAAIASAAYSLNSTIVPMYESQLHTDWKYILNDSGCTVLFCATQEIFKQVREEVLPSTPQLKATLCLDAPAGEQYSFATALCGISERDTSFLIQKPTPEDLADLIYTSGTTGKLKGVELTHKNIATNVSSGLRCIAPEPRNLKVQCDRSLAFLPWAHSYGQTCELWAGICQGSAIGICRGITHILEDLQLVKPNILFAVPTLYKKIFDGVHNTMESSSPIKKYLMKRALDLGRRNADIKHGLRKRLSLVERLELQVLDKLVLSKIRNRLGGRLSHSFVAGAACPAEVIDFFDDIGISICEGYGLTETSPIIAINTPEMRKIGYVGRPIHGVNVYIMKEGKEVARGEEGEVCCAGPNIMRGYHNQPGATNDVTSTAPDGFSRMFHTGDLGRMGEDGFIKVTGRLKEQYKLENGKYVAPTPIEESIGMSRFFNQVVLSGANKPHNVALIVPDWPSIRTELGIGEDATNEELTNDKRVKTLVDAEIAAHCCKLKKYEVPHSWAFVSPFTTENLMLTPKMSIRRHKVISTHKELIDSMYGIEASSGEEEAA